MSNRRDRAAARAQADDGAAGATEVLTLEAGVAPTEQVTSIAPVDGPDAPMPEAPTTPQDAPSDEPTAIPVQVPQEAPKPIQATLTGGQMAEIAIRNKAVDDARARANVSRETAILDERLATWAQEALSGLLGRYINEADLDPGIIYRVDIEKGELVPARMRNPQGG